MDLKSALRSLRKNPGVTLLAVLVMALGIGSSTAVFSVVRTVLLDPLAYRDPDRIVTLASLWKREGSRGQVSAPDFRDWHDQSTAFTAAALYKGFSAAVSARESADFAGITRVSPEFFRVFDVDPILGRLFDAEEVKPGSGGAVVISHAYWQSRFGGDPTAVGQTIRMFGRTLTIVGVLPPRFDFPGKTDLWFPADTIISETTSRSAQNYLVAGRLKPDVSLEQAQAQMTSIGARLEQQHPSSNTNKSVAVTRLRDEMVKDVRLTLYILFGAVGVVLLIACANVANLLLAKATARTREIAIRVAVGAGRARIIRQLMSESLLLALVAGAAGVVLAVWESNALVKLAPGNVPRLADTHIDGWVLAFALGVCVLTSFLFGLAPALQLSRIDLNEALKQGAARAVAGGGAGRLRGALVVAEVALSVVLLAGAGLLLKSFVSLHNVALGFRPGNLLVMTTSVPVSSLEAARRSTRFYKDLLSEVATLPGVLASGATRTPPGHVSSNGGYKIDNQPWARDIASTPQAVFSVVTPGAFGALGIPLIRGRDFNGADTYDAPFTTVINEALARKAFPGQDPIGHSIVCGFDSPKPMLVVGVVGDVRQYGPARQPEPEIYMPYEQHPRAAMGLRVIVRTATAPTALADTIRRKARDLSAEVPVTFTTMEASLAENVAAPRFRTLLLGVFAALAVCLAMAGVYGVMAYAVSQRSGEIGVRMALGASPADVLRLVLRQGFALAAAGLLLGLAGAFAATRLLTNFLFEVKPGDPMTYVAVSALLAVVSLAASFIPARRATKVDPLVALRQD
ncbi:MAG: ABC transporter permease [Bryobacteraceae bacterium]